uniref:Similar to IBR3 (IBA-RESPONSE 3) n=1 Tax=Arundo donax TaxID=35708 RepID=A0A0A9CLB8_ARUDO
MLFREVICPTCGDQLVLKIPFLSSNASFLACFIRCIPLTLTWNPVSEQARLLVLEAADQLDRHGNKKACGILAMAKVAAPNMALQVLDMAMQVHGAPVCHLTPSYRTYGRPLGHCGLQTAPMKSISGQSRSWSCKEQGCKNWARYSFRE